MRKQKIKSFIWGFVIIFILSSFFTIVLLNLITKFCYLNSDYVIIISIIVGIIIGILGGIYSLIRLMETKTSYFNYWIDHHWPNLLLLYFITIIILASIKTSIIWSVDDIKNIITLEWNIFGIAIAIFLFWYIFIEKYIRDGKPIKRNTNGPIEILSYINEKSNFQQSIDLLFMSVIIITINMFMLLTSTAMVFISTPNNINLFIQNIVIITFYLCINSISSLFLDMIKPLFAEKNKILDENKMTKIDLENKNNMIKDVMQITELIDAIEQANRIDDEQKSELINILVNDFIKQDFDSEE